MNMRIVLDTNILLPSISSNSSTHLIVSSMISGKYQLCVTTDILLEYEEKIAEKFNIAAADNFLKALLKLPSVERIEKYYFWQLISADPDDNKFVCYCG
jgi:predicted nucleic acid-binding protein